MINITTTVKFLAFALFLGAIVWGTVQSGGIKSLNGKTVVAFNQNAPSSIAEDLSAIATAAGE